jgi:hypothetical protein
VVESDEEAFELFYADLRGEVLKSGQEEVSEEEARELFVMMREEYSDMISASPEELGLYHAPSSQVSSSAASQMIRANSVLQTAERSPGSTTTFLYDGESSEMYGKHDLAQVQSTRAFEAASFEASTLDVFESEDESETEADAQLEELRQLLPTFSDARLSKVLRVFQKSLGDPPLLELIPIVRENLPDYLTATWLKQMSALTAKFVVHNAEQEDLVTVELLNSILELAASCGSLDRAIEFHQSEFARHGLKPTGYSDRLVSQMLLKNNRFSRALAFKDGIEQDGRSLDIKAYGSLIEYCSRRGQMGSAMLLLKECLSVHGAPPGEATLSKLRLLCRQTGQIESAKLDALIGPDPIEWLRYGEANLKREMSKRGRRDVQLARNRLVRL